MKLLIAVPAMDFVHVEFLKSLLRLTNKLKDDGIDFETRIESGSLVHMARDRLARYAMNANFSHVLWLDSDMVFEPEILEDLQFSGKPFVTGIAHGRRKPYMSCLFKSYWPEVIKWEYKDYPHNTFEVAACGFAAVLIETKILSDVILKFNTGFTPTEYFGEDVAFCDRARQLGHKVYAEPGVRLGHVGHITIYPEDSFSYELEK